jgi:uncharacterized protein YxeA
MKIAIVILSVLLVVVGGAFAYDHMSLAKKNEEMAATMSKMQSAGRKQADAIKIMLTCVNEAERAYKDNKTHLSVSACIKARMSLQ